MMKSPWGGMPRLGRRLPQQGLDRHAQLPFHGRIAVGVAQAGIETDNHVRGILHEGGKLALLLFRPLGREAGFLDEAAVDHEGQAEADGGGGGRIGDEVEQVGRGYPGQAARQRREDGPGRPQDVRQDEGEERDPDHPGGPVRRRAFAAAQICQGKQTRDGHESRVRHGADRQAFENKEEARNQAHMGGQAREQQGALGPGDSLLDELGQSEAQQDGARAQHRVGQHDRGPGRDVAAGQYQRPAPRLQGPVGHEQRDARVLAPVLPPGQQDREQDGYDRRPAEDQDAAQAELNHRTASGGRGGAQGDRDCGPGLSLLSPSCCLLYPLLRLVRWRKHDRAAGTKPGLPRSASKLIS